MTARPLFHVLCFAGMFMAIFLWQPGSEVGGQAVAPAPGAAKPAAADTGRLVVLVMDAWRDDAKDHPELHPGIHKLAARPDAHWVNVRTCAGNFTLPCMQTLFEGRESPFSSGLHNYTGREGSPNSLAGIAAARGLRVGNISDQSLTSLYGESAVFNSDCSAWPPNPLKRDLRSVDEALKALREHKVQVLLYHVVGTDKLSHEVEYESPKYREHYNLLDAKLASLWAELDFSKDALLITGDHGHGEHGHHTRSTPGLFVGRHFGELFAALKKPPDKLIQQDLLFFMGYPQLLPLPPEYEGAYFADLKPGAPAQLHQYLELHRKNLKERGFTGATLAAQSAAFKRSQADRPWQEFKLILPGLLCLLGLLFWVASAPRASGRERLFIATGWAMGAALMILLSTPSRGLWLSILPGAAMVAPLFFRERRRLAALLLLLLALTALLAYVAIDWKEYFHVRDGYALSQPLFYVSAFLVGFPLALVGWGRASLVAYGALLFAVFALPNGPYYYQVGPNLVQNYWRAAALVVLVTFLASPGRVAAARTALGRPGAKLAGALLLVATPLLFWQEAGGWVWLSYLEPFFADLGVGPTVAVYYLTGAALVAGLPGLRRRIIFGVLWAASHGYVVGLAEIGHPNYVSSMVPVAALLGWVLWRRARVRATEGEDGDFLGSMGSLVVFAALLTNLWFIMRGFTVANADWGFAYKYLSWVRHDATWFGLALVLCIPKYGMGMVMSLVYIAMLSKPGRVVRLFDHLLLLVMLKEAFYFTQVMFGSIRPGEKLHELAMGGVIFLALFMPMFAVTYLLLWASHAIRQRRSRA